MLLTILGTIAMLGIVAFSLWDRNSAGDVHGNRCQVSSHAGADNKAVYWSESLDPQVQAPPSFKFPVG